MHLEGANPALLRAPFLKLNTHMMLGAQATAPVATKHPSKVHNAMRRCFDDRVTFAEARDPSYRIGIMVKSLKNSDHALPSVRAIASVLMDAWMAQAQESGFFKRQRQSASGASGGGL